MSFQRTRDWDLSFGPTFGLAGTITTIVASPQVLFRGRKIMATDSGTPAGTGTRIMQMLVGQRMQRPSANGSSLVAFFGPGALGNGVTFDTAQPALTIAVTVSFVQDCTFDMSIFGEATV